MSRTRVTPEQSQESATPDQASAGTGLGSPLLGLQGLMGNAAMAGMMGLGVMGPMGGLLGAGAALAAGALTPKKEYVDMGASEKTNSLVGLMNGSRDVLKANGVSEHMESKMAAIMQNEGSRNLRRQALGKSFSGSATELSGKLKGVDLEKMKADPAALQKFSSGLTEDQRFLFEQVQSGSLNLADMNSKDQGTKDRVREQLTELGIQKRTSQYEEMTGLMNKKSSGALSKEETARLTKLQGMTGLGMGKTTMGSLSGLSSGRFAEIYREGQERFEPAQYIEFKKDYEAGLKNRKDPDKPIAITAGIGNFSVDKGMEGQLANNYDLFADMCTSYGISQVMGAYAQAGLLKSKGADGQDHTVSLDEMKASGQRLTPTTEDVQQQLAFFNMKGINPSSTNMSDDAITRKYNGSKPGSDLYTQYMNGLATGTPAYKNAKAKQGKA